jgi:hypothetical protein
VQKAAVVARRGRLLQGERARRDQYRLKAQVMASRWLLLGEAWEWVWAWAWEEVVASCYQA